jgi:hypothetical protein
MHKVEVGMLLQDGIGIVMIALHRRRAKGGSVVGSSFITIGEDELQKLKVREN